MAALSGGTAGILGLSTLYGFAFYGVSVVVLWLLVLWKVGKRYSSTVLLSANIDFISLSPPAKFTGLYDWSNAVHKKQP